MGVRITELLAGQLDALRYEPTAKRIRVFLAGEPVADTTDARLVWEPRRIVPAYAVPVAHMTAQLVPGGAESGDHDGGFSLPDVWGHLPLAGDDRPLLDPSVPFPVHSCPGTVFDVVAGDQTAGRAAFRPDDADLAEHVVLEFDAF